jgi:hypothetical protein
MKMETQYTGKSGVESGLQASRVGFATNLLRQATYFQGEVARPLVLREALGALHGVVVSDLRYQPKDRLAFRAWLAEQDRQFLRGLQARSADAKAQLERVEAELEKLNARREERRRPFVAARTRYASYVFQNEVELQFLYDPVVTVHPDEVFFEAFSKDESSYARVGARRALFAGVDGLTCGTTNIDFSAALARQLDRMRSYRRTRLDVAPGGVDVTVDGEVHKEKKIELPETWVQGFHQVQSTMTMSLTSFDVTPLDLMNLLKALRRRKARTSPRALRFELIAGKRIRAVLEPWETPIELSTTWRGEKDVVVRTWGRDRYHVLARLLPVARGARIHLAGLGLPSIIDVDLGDLSFTLALSGWTDNDWASGAKFDLLTRRLDGTSSELLVVYAALQSARLATDVEVAQRTGLSIEKARSALSYLCQVGRAMFDLHASAYRHRDLFFDAFTAQQAEAAVSVVLEQNNPRATIARAIFESDNVRIIARRPVSTGFKLSGSVLGPKGERVRPQLHVDGEGKIIEGSCTCAHHASHQLTQGPCEHLLALRLAHMRVVEQSDDA